MGIKKQDLLELFNLKPDKKYSFEELVKIFRISTKPRKKLMPLLQSLLNTGALARDEQGLYSFSKEPQKKKVLKKEQDFVVGKVLKTKGGFGFVLSDDAEDVHLSKQEIEWNGIMNGDVVKVTKKGNFLDFVSRRDNLAVGIIVEEHNRLAIKLKGTNEFISIQHGRLNRARAGDWVEFDIKKYSSGRSSAQAEVLKVIDKDDELVIKQLGIRDAFSEEVLSEAEKINEPEYKPQGDTSRKDLTLLEFVTIDGEDAKDFDDAVYCEKNKEGFVLYVAIADVSNYVKEGSKLDEEAYLRTTSVYFPDRAVPMLPEHLSNNVCCLRPNTYRYVMVFEMHLDKTAKLIKSKNYKAVIKSKARLTYTVVQAFFDKRETELPDNIKIMISKMHELYKLLRKNSKLRGTIFMEVPEAQIILNQDGTIDKILKRPVWDAHSLIEEFMILANIEAAKKMRSMGFGVYRVHEKPDKEKLSNYAETAKLYKADFKSSWTKAGEFSNFLESIKKHPAKLLLNKLFLRSLKKAKYSSNPEGHFALSLSDYSHFTSPIRRYPDLIVHRLLSGEYKYNQQKLEEITKTCSEGEIKAQEAERTIVKIKQARYLENKINMDFVGEITGFNNYGIFVQLKDVFIEGYLPFSKMGYERLVFDEARMAILGKKNSIKYKLGDDIQVYVSEVDVFEGKIEFGLYI